MRACARVSAGVHACGCAQAGIGVRACVCTCVRVPTEAHSDARINAARRAAKTAHARQPQMAIAEERFRASENHPEHACITASVRAGRRRRARRRRWMRWYWKCANTVRHHPCQKYKI